MTSNLAVVICHGSYHTPTLYQPLVDALKNKGINAYCPQLPTSDLARLNVGDINTPDFDREPPEGGYPQGDNDAQVVLDVLTPLIEEQEKDVLVIGHSSGGWTATEAARPSLLAKARKEQGLKGGIIGILYIGGFVIPVGESIHTFFQPKDGTVVQPHFMRFHKHGLDGLGTMVEPEKYLLNGLDPGEAAKWAGMLTANPMLTAKLTNDAYANVPCAYLVLEGDLILPRQYQEGMVELQQAKTGDFTLYHSPSGHSPQLTWTKGVVDTVVNFAAKVTGDSEG